MSLDQSTTKNEKREHLNQAERKTIERMLREGANKAEIARALLRDKSTIKREIKRGSVVQRRRNPYQSKSPQVPEYLDEVVYRWDVGQRVYEANRRHGGAKSKLMQCGELVSFVERMILSPAKWSPDAALGYARARELFPGQQLSTKTFYNWIEKGLVKVRNIDLLLKVRRRPKRPAREHKRMLGRSIDERPEQAQRREEFGHWEGDGIVGKGQRGFLISLVERKIGIGLLFNVGNRKSEHIEEVLAHLKQQFGEYYPQVIKSITFDNGPEFANGTAMERDHQTIVYYAHPYSSWERGTNENWNGIVRRFLPKGKSFDDVTDETLLRITHYINTLPRKRFGYKTPQDLWHEQWDAIVQTSS